MSREDETTVLAKVQSLFKRDGVPSFAETVWY